MIRLSWRERLVALFTGRLPARRARYDALEPARTKTKDTEDSSRHLVELFERAFSGRVAGLRRRCHCGVEYWDSYNDGYDWEAGEREALLANPKAVAVDYAVGLVVFEGKHYADACTCWHERAMQIARFLIGHDEAIAEFLTRRKQALEREAERAPQVKHPAGSYV